MARHRIEDTRDAWLQPALAYVPLWLEYQMRATKQPGCLFAIAHRGEVQLDGAFGYANAATGEKLTPRHRFRVASHSKSFAATAILKLRDLGKVTLDDPVGKYVRDLHSDIAEVTVAELLSHTAGIVRDGFDRDFWSGRASFPDERELRADLKRAPILQANERPKYTNHGFGLVAFLVEAITGEDYRTWLTREVIDAAGLTETTTDMPIPEGALLASGHSSEVLLGNRVVIPGERPANALAGAAGVVSTAADLAKFFSQLSPYSPHSVLSVDGRRAMIWPRWRDPYAAEASGYGLGIICDTSEGWQGFGHTGGFPGYTSRTFVIPDHDLAICVLTNAAEGFSGSWTDGVVHILKRFQAEGPPTDSVSDWTGRWWGGGEATDFVPMGDKVFTASPRSPKPFDYVSEFTVEGPDRGRCTQSSAFYRFGETMRRFRDASGDVVEIQMGNYRMFSEAALADEWRQRYQAVPSRDETEPV